MATITQQEAKAQKEVDKWNNEHLIAGIRVIREDDLRIGHETKTTGLAYVMGGTAVIQVEDYHGCYALSRIHPIKGMAATGLAELTLEAGKTYVVELLDWGQDFLKWEIKDGVIVWSDLQGIFWCGTKVHNTTIKPGDFLSLTTAKGNPEQKQSYLKYPVIKVTEKEG